MGGKEGGEARGKGGGAPRSAAITRGTRAYTPPPPPPRGGQGRINGAAPPPTPPPGVEQGSLKSCPHQLGEDRGRGAGPGKGAAREGVGERVGAGNLLSVLNVLSRSGRTLLQRDKVKGERPDRAVGGLGGGESTADSPGTAMGSNSPQHPPS